MKYAHLRKYLPLANSADEGRSTVSGRVKLGTVKKGTNVYLHSKKSPSCQCCKFSSRDAQEAEFKDNPQWIVTLSPGWGKVLPSPAEMFCWRQEKSVNISALTLRCTPDRSVTRRKQKIPTSTVTPILIAVVVNWRRGCLTRGREVVRIDLNMKKKKEEWKVLQVLRSGKGWRTSWGPLERWWQPVEAEFQGSWLWHFPAEPFWSINSLLDDLCYN